MKSPIQLFFALSIISVSSSFSFANEPSTKTTIHAEAEALPKGTATVTEARATTIAEAKAQAEARLKAETEAKARAEARAKAKAEARARVDAKTKTDIQEITTKP